MEVQPRGIVGSQQLATTVDPLGTRRVQANAQGETEEECQNLPFGDQQICNGTDATPLHFTGKERDPESGNDYFGARYYASGMGRFLSPDWSATVSPVPYASLPNPQSLNLYAYVMNNPLTHIDPSGHYGQDSCVTSFCPASSHGGPGSLMNTFQASLRLSGASLEAFFQIGPDEDSAEEELLEAQREKEENALKPKTDGSPVEARRVPGAIYPGEKGPLDPQHAKNFDWYVPWKTRQDTTFYRQWGGAAGPTGRGGGTYYSFFPPEGSTEFMRNQMSLPSKWNSMEFTNAVKIPAGTTIYIGPASAQPGFSYSGG